MLYAIGDVHGCARTLDALLHRLGADAGGSLRPSDTLVFVGDYIDRGPDSAGVIDRAIALEAASEAGTGPTCVFLRGNHDQMMLDYIDGKGDPELWWANGGRTTLQSYENRREWSIPTPHIEFLRRTALIDERDGFIFVHAGLNPAKTIAGNLADPDPETLLWSRRHLQADLSRWETPVVCGHTPVTEPIDTPKLIDIDTGAVFVTRDGLGRLTAVALPERRFIAVETVDYQPWAA